MRLHTRDGRDDPPPRMVQYGARPATPGMQRLLTPRPYNASPSWEEERNGVGDAW